MGAVAASAAGLTAGMLLDRARNGAPGASKQVPQTGPWSELPPIQLASENPLQRSGSWILASSTTSPSATITTVGYGRCVAPHAIGPDHQHRLRVIGPFTWLLVDGVLISRFTMQDRKPDYSNPPRSRLHRSPNPLRQANLAPRHLEPQQLHCLFCSRPAFNHSWQARYERSHSSWLIFLMLARRRRLTPWKKKQTVEARTRRIPSGGHANCSNGLVTNARRLAQFHSR